MSAYVLRRLKVHPRLSWVYALLVAKSIMSTQKLKYRICNIETENAHTG
jgi:hypothetical protein